MVLDAAHEKSTESSSGPKREEIMESILFKCSDFVVVQFKDTDSSYARRGRLWFPSRPSPPGVIDSLQQSRRSCYVPQADLGLLILLFSV